MPRSNRLGAVGVSLLLTAGECVLFFAVCVLQAIYAPAKPGAAFSSSLVAGVFQGYLALVGAIATTWYVVFTFYLMRSTIEYNQQWSIPYLNVEWLVTSELPALTANTPYFFSGPGGGTVPQGLHIGQKDFRWVVLALTNVRPKPIDRISFKISVLAESDGMWAVKPFEISCDKRGLKLEKDRQLQIGISDVLLLPKNFVLKFQIKEIGYSAIDSAEQQTLANGDRVFAIGGLAMIVPSKEG